MTRRVLSEQNRIDANEEHVPALEIDFEKFIVEEQQEAVCLHMT